jgi:hypothetical protein
VFGRDPRFEAEGRAVIHRWDRRGVGFHQDILGHRLLELDHVFRDTPRGVDYRSWLRVGAGVGALKGALERPRRATSGQRDHALGEELRKSTKHPTSSTL